MTIPSLPEIKKSVSAWVTGKGWREAWASGSDIGGPGGASACPAPLKNSTWVFRCLQLISDQVRSQPLVFSTLDRSGKQMMLNDPDTLAFWSQPAETASGAISQGDFLELACKWIGLKGQAFLILDDTWLTPRGVKSRIILARADRLTPIMRGDMLLGWQFLDGIGGRHTLLPQQVIRPRHLNPYNDAEGLSALDPARVAVDADYAAGVFARNTAASNGDQGVYVIAKGGAALSTEQREQIIAQLRQKAQLSKRGDYRPAFLTADVAVEDPKIKSVDAAFNDGRMESRHEIAVAFGVPPSMMDRMDSYSVGAASDRFRLIEDTCIPMSVRLCEAFALIERLRTGRVLIVEQDWGKHPVMRQARQERTKAACEMHARGVPWQVLSDLHDLNLQPFAGWDAAWLPMSLERVSETADEESPNDATKDATEDDASKLMATRQKTFAELRGLIAALPVQEACSKSSRCACGNCEQRTENSEQNARDPERVKLWQKHMTARAPSEKLMAKKVTKCLMTARAETLAKLESSEKALAGVRARGILDILFDLGQFTISMIENTRAAHKDTLEQAVMQFAEEIGATDPWQIEDPKVFTFLNKRESRIRDASRRIWNDIKSAVEQGLKDGETNAQIANRVRTAFNGISKERAESIANTEVSAAYGFARDQSMQGLGIEEKEWLASGLDSVRDSHRIADGQRVAMDAPFVVPMKDGGSEEMMYPGDEDGSAENVINCKCVQVAVMRED
jgi:hypothetical protein